MMPPKKLARPGALSLISPALVSFPAESPCSQQSQATLKSAKQALPRAAMTARAVENSPFTLAVTSARAAGNSLLKMPLAIAAIMTQERVITWCSLWGLPAC